MLFKSKARNLCRGVVAALVSFTLDFDEVVCLHVPHAFRMKSVGDRLCQLRTSRVASTRLRKPGLCSMGPQIVLIRMS